jgi:hypothetical protein
MNPTTLSAVLLAVVTGTSEALGSRLWAGMASLVRRPPRNKHDYGHETAVVSSGEAELAALEQAPGDKDKALALAEKLMARADADSKFRQGLAAWWRQAEPIRVSIWGITNTISGGIQQGPVLQGRDFSNLNIGATQMPPPNDRDASQ